MTIGSLYSKKGIVVGQAAGFYAPANTALPADTGVVFDEIAWGTTNVVVGGATGGNFALTLSNGPLSSPATISNIASSATPAAVAAAIQALLPSSYIVAVTGTASQQYNISIVGPGSLRIKITGNGTALTGGTGFRVVPPPWNSFGGTEQGWQSNYDVSSNDIRIEEQVTKIGQFITEASQAFVANLSEDTIENLNVAMASTLSLTAAGTGVYGRARLALSNDLPVFAVALETKNRFGLPRRVYIPEATCAVNVGQTFRRAAAQRMIPVTFSSVCETERIIIDDLVALPTG